MAFTLGAALAHAGTIFPVVSSYLGWAACFLSGSDTAANVLFGNLRWRPRINYISIRCCWRRPTLPARLRAR